MKRISYIVAASAVSVFATSAALAEQKDVRPAEGGNLFTEQTPAVSNALELGVGAGYAQGVGDIAKGRPNTVQDFSGPGGAVEIDVGYRFSPNFMLGVYGTGAQYARGDALVDGTAVRSATAGVQANWHFRPGYTVDPWIGLATGWRGLWMTPDTGKTTTLHGLELARLQVGADYRLTPEVAISPVLGADMSTYLTENNPSLSGFTNITDPRVNFGFFAGIMGRFDVLGKTSQTASASKSNTF
jgi:hypothetical protein